MADDRQLTWLCNPKVVRSCTPGVANRSTRCPARQISPSAWALHYPRTITVGIPGCSRVSLRRSIFAKANIRHTSGIAPGSDSPPSITSIYPSSKLTSLSSLASSTRDQMKAPRSSRRLPSTPCFWTGRDAMTSSNFSISPPSSSSSPKAPSPNFALHLLKALPSSQVHAFNLHVPLPDFDDLDLPPVGILPALAIFDESGRLCHVHIFITHGSFAKYKRGGRSIVDLVRGLCMVSSCLAGLILGQCDAGTLHPMSEHSV